jgi:hypothetical protein
MLSARLGHRAQSPCLPPQLSGSTGGCLLASIVDGGGQQHCPHFQMRNSRLREVGGLTLIVTQLTEDRAGIQRLSHCAPEHQLQKRPRTPAPSATSHHKLGSGKEDKRCSCRWGHLPHDLQDGSRGRPAQCPVSILRAVNKQGLLRASLQDTDSPAR